MRFPKTFVGDIPRRKFLELGLKGGLALAVAPRFLTQLLAGQGTSASSVKVEADPTLLNRTVAKALEKGGDFAEVYIEKRISRTILMEESKFKSAMFGISQGAGVRVIAGEKTGYAYTDEIADDKLLRAAEVASTIARGSRTSKPVDIHPGRRKSFITIKLPLE
jgi:TldD protein